MAKKITKKTRKIGKQAAKRRSPIRRRHSAVDLNAFTPGTTCEMAQSLVTGARHVQHGEFDACFNTIAQLWSVYLTESGRASSGSDHPATKTIRVVVTPADVAQLMILLKIARVANGRGVNHDNAVDIAGYADLYNAIVSKEQGGAA